MTDLAREQIEQAEALAHTHEQAELRDPIKARGKRHRAIHVTIRSLLTALAEAQAAQAATVERCAGLLDGLEDACVDDAVKLWAKDRAAAIRSRADPTGVALLAELRARVERAEAERDAAAAIAATAYGASLDWEQILKDDALWYAQDDIAKSRVACMAAEAERDRLAAANAALEAKVAGLAEALKKADTALSDEGYRETQWPRPQIRAALATQEAGNAQSTPPISPEEAQFNAVRHHERFGPLDEKGNPVDPRRRG